jgi:hypothetical protein
MFALLFVAALIIIIAVVAIFFVHAEKLTFIILSRVSAGILIGFIWLSSPEYDRTWVDSYDDRNGYHDVYEVTYTGEDTKFENIFGERYTPVAYGVFNTFFCLFLIYLFYLCKKVHKPFNFIDVDYDVVAMLCFAGLFLYNPFDPLIKYLPPNWVISIGGLYTLALILWICVCGESKRLYRLPKEEKLSDV